MDDRSPTSSASEQKPLRTPRRLRRVFTTFGLLALTAWLVGTLPSCDSTAKFSIDDRKFADVQVVSTFPVHIDAQGVATRVCGVPLENENDLIPNGLELMMNFVSTEVKSSACNKDRDLSIKEGELIELYGVKTTGVEPTVGINNFQVSIGCIGPQSDSVKADCSTGISAGESTPASVDYVSTAPRCNPAKESSRLNVAVLMDHTGSVSGFVSDGSLKEDNPGKRTPPDPLRPSDPTNSRIPAAEDFTGTCAPTLDGCGSGLNLRDRLVGYYFNESKGVQVSASDARSCVGGSADGKRCIVGDDCPGGDCFDGGVEDTFDLLSLGDQQKKAFGSNAASRMYLKAALNNKVKYGGEGRSNIWDAVDTAYAHLKEKIANGARHIVVLTDGPETCNHSEQFSYVGDDGKCRNPCLNAQQSFKALRQRMHNDEYPVHIHVVQFQAPGYKDPSAQLQELACRSGGSFQFINTQTMVTDNASAISASMKRAMLRVRYALSGYWRINMKLNAIADPNQVKIGEMQALRGFLKFENARFPSLPDVFQETESWRFGPVQGGEDRRALFRRACKSDADCGGSDPCGANHCTEAGICVSGNAPDRLPCGAEGSGQQCCKGVCSPDCAGACK